jgi:phage tail protein X
LRRLLSRERVYRVASGIAHVARVFAASVLVSLLFFHANEGAATVGPLALTALAVIVAPAALESERARR